MGRWMAIKGKKAASDAKKGVALARYSREIMSAARQGGADLSVNFRLRTAVDAASKGGLAKDNIENAILKATGQLKGDELEELSYEGYGPGGVAIFIECETDNRNRTAGDIRSYFTKNNGNLGSDGCVSYMFEPYGRILIKVNDEEHAEQWMETAIEAEAYDVLLHNDDDETWVEVITQATDLNAVCERMKALSTEDFAPDTVELTRIASTMANVTDPDIAKPLVKLIGLIEDHDDVNKVHHNIEMSDELWEQFS